MPPPQRDVDHHEAVLALLHTVVAAVDTTRAALPPVLALLGLQGGMQESLREEQREVRCAVLWVLLGVCV